MLGIQELTQMVIDLQAELDSVKQLQRVAWTSGAYTNYSGGELDYLDLSGFDLSNGRLIGVRFDYSDLSNCDLSGSDLTSAQFSFANLHGADLSNALFVWNNANYATMTCLRGCPLTLKAGYICEPDPDCAEADRFRIVPD